MSRREEREGEACSQASPPPPGLSRGAPQDLSNPGPHLQKMPSTHRWAEPPGGHPVPTHMEGTQPQPVPVPLTPSLPPPAALLPITNRPCCALASRWSPGSVVPKAQLLKHTSQPRLLLSPLRSSHPRRVYLSAYLFIWEDTGGRGFLAPPGCPQNVWTDALSLLHRPSKAPPGCGPGQAPPPVGPRFPRL